MKVTAKPMPKIEKYVYYIFTKNISAVFFQKDVSNKI